VNKWKGKILDNVKFIAKVSIDSGSAEYQAESGSSLQLFRVAMNGVLKLKSGQLGKTSLKSVYCFKGSQNSAVSISFP
jgi:putative salt-induced outer membrane protein YdiY